MQASVMQHEAALAIRAIDPIVGPTVPLQVSASTQTDRQALERGYGTNPMARWEKYNDHPSLLAHPVPWHRCETNPMLIW